MAKYLLIESRDPFECNDVTHNYELAKNLKEQGNEVTLFLVQNGVLPARRSTQSKSLAEVAKAGVELLADDFSLKERGIYKDRIVDGVKAAPLDTVIDQLVEGRKVIWH